MKTALKTDVLACKDICGTHVVLDDPAVTEILGGIGFDFIWIDTEHTAIDGRTLQLHLGAARMSGTPAIVRVAMNDRNQVKRVLEMGPSGIVFPMVNTRDEADRAMRMCLYPPQGERGFGPLRAVGYGKRDANEYIANASDELCRFIQIETESAVRNLPEIVKNPYIDGYIFGPCDLSGSIGELNNVFGDNNIRLIKEAVHILESEGKCIGVSTSSTDPEILKFWHGLHINMISCGVDYGYLREGALANRENLGRILRCRQA